MIELINYACERYSMTLEEACKKIGYNHTNLGKVKSGSQSFKVGHFENAERLVKDLNYNWLFGKERNMTRKPPTNPVDALKVATRSIEEVLKIK